MQKITCDDRSYQLSDDVAHALLDVIAMAKRDGKSFEIEVPVRSGPMTGENRARLTITPSTRFDVAPATDTTSPSRPLMASVVQGAHGQAFSREDAAMTGPWDDL
jgi:hypothetical protein